MSWFGLFKSKKTETEKASLSQRLGEGLAKTRARMAGIGNIFKRDVIDEDTIETLEDTLLSADVSIPTCNVIIDGIKARAKQSDPQTAFRDTLIDLIQPLKSDLTVTEGIKPYVILVVGVNGSGKTTTIGKLTKKLQQEGKRVMLAAGDTFRAAASEQLATWGERNNVPVIRQAPGADPAAVIFDAYQSAQARGSDVLIADTAGRLQNQSGLMDELAKIRRVLGKAEADAPHETLLVIDGTTGQNALQQAKLFKDIAHVTGVVVTKLDGSARGGMIFTLAHELAIPVRFIGVGESVDDLQLFDPDAFVDTLLDDN
ncbi:MAG: signal recognition particle-docking protein FtsY [Gammaproteobacteria bacterium]|nr:signal recognition particle-docking protein FtsY [Gammaproteobacteria bacterium]